jgi:hypothetical protein
MRLIMESRILGSLGKVAGLGGIALGVFLILFRGVLEKQFLPQAGVAAEQAFAVILSLMIMTFGIASIGIVAWLRSGGPKAPVPLPGIGILAALMVLLLGAAIYVGAQAKPAKPTVSATGGGVVIGRDAVGTTITTAPPFNPTQAIPAK